MAAMFVTATGVAVRDSVRHAQSFAISGAFRWLQTDFAQRLLPAQIWREALATPAAERLKDKTPLKPDELAFCTWLVPPKDLREIISPRRRDLIQLAESGLDAIPRPLRTHTAFLLVALGLQLKGEEGIRLLGNGFFAVYEALETMNYSTDSWMLLAPELPRSASWKEWDRCGKLRKAMRRRFDRYHETNPLFCFARTHSQREIAQTIFTSQDEDEGVN
jgi:hypothetical protein